MWREMAPDARTEVVVDGHRVVAYSFGQGDETVFCLNGGPGLGCDYLREAHRTLKLDGDLHIIEATSRFANRDGFLEGLKGLGFAVVSVEDKWKFTHLRALKTEHTPGTDVTLEF